MPGRVIHRRDEAIPPHGEVIRLDIRRPAEGVPRTAILVAHGFKGFKDWGFFPHLCEALARAGHLVVSFNGSRNGVGPGLLDFTEIEFFGRNTISHELADLHWMLDRLGGGEWSDEPPRAIGLLGHSRGGGCAVVATAERNDLSALVTWAAISTFDRWTAEQMESWQRSGVIQIMNARTGQVMPIYREVQGDFFAHRERFDPAAAAARVRVPWLAVHGTEDETVPLEEARTLVQAGRMAALAPIEGSGHTFEATHPMTEAPPGLETAIRVTLAHFRAHLGLGGDCPERNPGGPGAQG